jgi:hypothetical protein
MPVRKTTVRPTRVFAAKPGPVSGSAKLTPGVRGTCAGRLRGP